MSLAGSGERWGCRLEIYHTDPAVEPDMNSWVTELAFRLADRDNVRWVSSAEPGRLLGIGAFARRSRLSVKALRLYDRQGLLTPAAVDPRTGYRRYLESQLLSARLIVLMRR